MSAAPFLSSLQQAMAMSRIESLPYLYTIELWKSSMPNAPLLPLQRHASFAINSYRCVKRSELPGPLLKMSHSLAPTMTLLVVLQLMAHIPYVDAINLEACGARVLGRQIAAQNTTHTTDPSLLLDFSYEQCLVECGTGVGDVDWQGFSQTFGAWLLPWIALMFQIPFGAERKFRVLLLCCT